jgi:hypothetical protein
MSMGSTDPNAFDTSGPPPPNWTPPATDRTTGKVIANAPARAPEVSRPRPLPAETLSHQVPAIQRAFEAGYSPNASYNGQRVVDMSPAELRAAHRDVLEEEAYRNPLDPEHEVAKQLLLAIALAQGGAQPRGSAGPSAAPESGLLSPAEQHASSLTPEQQQWARHWASDADNVVAFQGTHLDAEALAAFDPNAVAVVRVAAARTGAPGDAVAEVLAQVHDFEAGYSRPAKDMRELYESLGRAMGRDGRQVVNQTEDVLERIMKIEPALRPRIEALFQGDERARARSMSPDIIRAMWEAGQRLGWVR